MQIQKSINGCQKQAQAQFHELLATAELRGRIMLGITEEFEWQQLNCVVPICSPVTGPADFTTLRMVVRFNVNNLSATPGLYVESPLIPAPARFINITEDCTSPSGFKTIREVVMDTINDIDRDGLLEWARKMYPAHLFDNKMDKNHIELVNQKSKLIIKLENRKKGQSQAITKSLEDSLQMLRFSNEFNGLSSCNSAFRLKLGGECKMQTKFGKAFDNLPLVDEIKVYGCGQNEYEVKSCQNGQENLLQIEKTNGDDNPCSWTTKNKMSDSEGLFDSNRMFLGHFSSFKPVIPSGNLLEKNKSANGHKNEEKKKEGFVKLAGSSFIPFMPCKKEVKAEKEGENSQSSNSSKPSQSPQPKKQAQNNYECPLSIVSSAADNPKGPKHPKPMNKNANLPKFLIRIFIKYIDKFKNMYVKREYDRLYSECKKMKEWKKNDRRQHAFGLKHLKIFFQDVIEGFPDPGLNRRVISKIIDNYLLEEICQNSQIPQSHRVGYLVACRVYSIRCRNIWLAGRIQSK